MPYFLRTVKVGFNVPPNVAKALYQRLNDFQRLGTRHLFDFGNPRKAPHVLLLISLPTSGKPQYPLDDSQSPAIINEAEGNDNGE